MRRERAGGEIVMVPVWTPAGVACIYSVVMLSPLSAEHTTSAQAALGLAGDNHSNETHFVFLEFSFHGMMTPNRHSEEMTSGHGDSWFRMDSNFFIPPRASSL